MILKNRRKYRISNFCNLVVRVLYFPRNLRIIHRRKVSIIRMIKVLLWFIFVKDYIELLSFSISLQARTIFLNFMKGFEVSNKNLYCIEEMSSRFQYSTSSYRSRASRRIKFWSMILATDTTTNYTIPFFDSVPLPREGFCFIFHLLVSNIYNMSPSSIHHPSAGFILFVTKQITPLSLPLFTTDNFVSRYFFVKTLLS